MDFLSEQDVYGCECHYHTLYKPVKKSKATQPTTQGEYHYKN